MESRIDDHPEDGDFQLPKTPLATGFFQPTFTVVVETSFDGTSTYVLQAINLKDSPKFSIKRTQTGGYAAGTGEKELSSSQLEKLAGMIHDAKVPPLADGDTGSDGTTYVLEMQSGMVKGMWRWWNQPPVEWRALGEIVKEIIRLYHHK